MSGLRVSMAAPGTPGISSVLDVEGVPQSLVQVGPAFEVKMTDWFGVEERDGNGDQVVAADDALIGKALCQSNFNLRTDTTDRSGDRRAGDRAQDGDRGVSREHADGSPPGWWSQISPYDVPPRYHSGAVSAASREAADTMAGSWGSLR